jgi:uncharacterized protein
MKALLFSFLLFTSSLVFAQSNSKRIDTIHSKILNGDRYLWVYIPASAKASAKRYPVVYVLDGEIFFDEAVNILNRLNKETRQAAPKEMIIVGIGNTWQRYKDYSPSHITSSPWVDSHTASATGGGDRFISFIEKEVFPHINATCPSSSTRFLIGHSMGGLIAMNILLKHTELFSFYAAIDPSMWWDNEKLLKESKTILANKTFNSTSLFLGIANTMDKNMTAEQMVKDTSANTALIRPSFTLLDHINAGKQNKLRLEWNFYKDYHHMTVHQPAMYDALKFFLETL